MFNIKDFKKRYYSTMNYKLLTEIVCDEVINRCNVDDEYINNETLTNFNYKIWLDPDVDPIYRTIYDVLENTQTKTIEELCPGIPSYNMIPHWIVNYFPKALATFYATAEPRYLKDLGGEEVLMRVLTSIKKGKSEYLSGIALDLASRVNKKISRDKPLDIIRLYKDTTYLRVGIRLHYKKLYNIDRAYTSSLNFFQILENDFKDASGWSYNDARDVYRMQDCLGSQFRGFIQEWVREKKPKLVIYSSYHTNNEGEIDVGDNSFDKFKGSYVEEDFDFKQFLQDCYQVNEEAFGKNEGGTNRVIAYTNVDWFKEKYLGRLCVELTKVYNSGKKFESVNINTTNKMVDKLRFSIEVPNTYQGKSEVRYRVDNRKELLEFVYNNYDKFTPLNLNSYLNQFLDIADSAQMTKDWSVYLISDKNIALASGGILNTRKEEYKNPLGRKELRKYPEYMVVANTWFKKYIAAVLAVRRLQEQLTKWGLTIVNFNTDILKKPLASNQIDSLKEYLLTDRLGSESPLNTLDDGFSLGEFIEGISSASIKASMYKAAAKELVDSKTTTESEVFRFITSKMLSVKQLTRLTKIYEEEHQVVEFGLDTEGLTSSMEKLTIRKKHIIFTNLLHDLLGYNTEGVTPNKIKLEMSMEAFVQDITGNIHRDLTSGQTDKLKTLKACIGITAIAMTSFNKLRESEKSSNGIKYNILMILDETTNQTTQGKVTTFNDMLTKYSYKDVNRILNNAVLTMIKEDRVGFYLSPEVCLNTIFNKKESTATEFNFGVVYHLSIALANGYLQQLGTNAKELLSNFQRGNSFANYEDYYDPSYINTNIIYMYLRKYQVVYAFYKEFNLLQKTISRLKILFEKKDYEGFLNLYETSNIQVINKVIKAKSTLSNVLGNETAFSRDTQRNLERFLVQTLKLPQPYHYSKSELDSKAEKELATRTVLKMFYLFVNESLTPELEKMLQQLKAIHDHALEKVKEEFNLGIKLQDKENPNDIFYRNKETLVKTLTQGINELLSETNNYMNPFSITGLPREIKEKYNVDRDHLNFLTNRNGFIMHKRDLRSTGGLTMYGFIHESGLVVYVYDELLNSEIDSNDKDLSLKILNETKVIAFDSIAQQLKKEGVV